MKKIVAVLLAFVLIVSLAACGKQEKQQAGQSEQAAQEQASQTSKDEEKVIAALKDQLGFKNAINGTDYRLFSVTTWSISETNWTAEGYVTDPDTGEKKPFKSSGDRGDDGGLLYSPSAFIIES